MDKTNLKEEHDKYLKLARDINTAMMLTGLGNKPVDAIPMTPKEIRDDGTVVFISKADSDHNANIAADPDTQLLFGDVSSKEFLSVYGATTISKDQALIDDLYSNLDNNWFDGKQDPSITILLFKPEKGYFWDTKSNALVSLAKLSYTAITGKPTEIGESGSLNL